MLGGEGGLQRVEALAQQQDPKEHAEENEALGHDLVDGTDCRSPRCLTKW